MSHIVIQLVVASQVTCGCTTTSQTTGLMDLQEKYFRKNPDFGPFPGLNSHFEKKTRNNLEVMRNHTKVIMIKLVENSVNEEVEK